MNLIAPLCKLKNEKRHLHLNIVANSYYHKVFHATNLFFSSVSNGTVPANFEKRMDPMSETLCGRSWRSARKECDAMLRKTGTSGLAVGVAALSIGFVSLDAAKADDFRRPAYRGPHSGAYRQPARYQPHHASYSGRPTYHHAPRPVYRPPAHVGGGYRPAPPIAYKPTYYRRPAYAYGCAPSYYTPPVYVEPAYSYAPAYYPEVSAPCYTSSIVVSRPVYYRPAYYRPAYPCGTGVSFGYYGSGGGFSFAYRR